MENEGIGNSATAPQKSKSLIYLLIFIVAVVVIGIIVFIVLNENGIGGAGSKTYTGESMGQQCSITINFSTGKWSYSGGRISYFGDTTILTTTQIQLQGNAINEVGKVNGMTKYSMLGNSDVNFYVYVTEDKSYAYITYYFSSYGIKCKLS